MFVPRGDTYLLISPQSLSARQRSGAEVLPRGRVPPGRLRISPGSLRQRLLGGRGQAQSPCPLELRPRGFNQGETPTSACADVTRRRFTISMMTIPRVCSILTGRAGLCWGAGSSRAWTWAAPTTTTTTTGSLASAPSCCPPADKRTCRPWPLCCRNSWRPSTRRSSKEGMLQLTSMLT